MKKFLKYIIVGGASYLLDIGSLLFFVELIKMHYLVAATLSMVIATFVNYFLNKAWSFQDNGKIIKSLPRYLLLVVFNYLYLAVMLYIFVEYYCVNYLVVKVVTMSTIVIWNFFLYRCFIYKYQTYNSDQVAS